MYINILKCIEGDTVSLIWVFSCLPTPVKHMFSHKNQVSMSIRQMLEAWILFKFQFKDFPYGAVGHFEFSL